MGKVIEFKRLFLNFFLAVKKILFQWVSNILQILYGKLITPIDQIICKGNSPSRRVRTEHIRIKILPALRDIKCTGIYGNITAYVRPARGKP